MASPIVQRRIPVDIHPHIDRIFKMALPFTDAFMGIPEAEFGKFSDVVDLYGIHPDARDFASLNLRHHVFLPIGGMFPISPKMT
jgi:hypothetical protein